MSQDCFGPSDFDREVQKHLDRYEKEKRKTKKVYGDEGETKTKETGRPPVDAGPTNARHHPKTLQARRRIRVQRNRHRVFRGQKRGSIQRIKLSINLFVNRGFLTILSQSSSSSFVLAASRWYERDSRRFASFPKSSSSSSSSWSVGDRSGCERMDGWTNEGCKRRNQRERCKRAGVSRVPPGNGRGRRTTTIGSTVSAHRLISGGIPLAAKRFGRQAPVRSASAG
jgi:hypothetical protein